MDHIERTVLNIFINLVTKRVKTKHFVLFGSRARGDAEPDSDMDVLVVVDGLTEDMEDYISECAWEAGFEYGIVLVPVTFSENEWENGPERYSLIAEAIRSEGVYL